MTDRLKVLEKALAKLPKDRPSGPVRRESYFNAQEWELIFQAYENGTSVKTIYDALPEPKNSSLHGFKEAFRRYRKHRSELKAAS